MSTKRTQVLLGLFLLLLFTAWFLSACQVTWDGDLSRDAGRRAREQVDELLDQLGEFMAGFCGSSAASLVLVGLVVLSTSRSRR